MFHQQVTFRTKHYRRKKMRNVKAFEEYERLVTGHRPVLFSSQDMECMAAESQRAQLFSQVVGQDVLSPREFTSYFVGPTSADPTYLITSHEAATSDLTPRRRPITPIFPSLMQNFQWKPGADTRSSISGTDITEKEPKFNCRCKNCTSKVCPARFTTSRAFRSNIVTFCNQATMTSKTTDTSCGLSVTDTSDTSVSAADVRRRLHVRDSFASPKCAAPIAPILKKQSPFSRRCYKFWKNREMPCDVHQHAVRDIDSDEFLCEPTTCESNESSRGKKGSCEGTRYTLYNEGISDSAAERYPLPTRNPSAKALRREGSKASVTSNKCWYERDGFIPFDHHPHSKYHQGCQRSDSEQRYCGSVSDEPRRQECLSPVKKTHKRIENQSKPPCIQLPKKVLASEKNIESFVKVTRKYQ